MRKSLIAKLLFIFLAFFLGTFLFEVFLRTFIGEPENLAKLKSSSVFLHENKPDVSFVYVNTSDGFRNEIILNHWGFRDDEFKKEKERGVFKIAVLGDSQEEALQVELSDTWQKVMARKLSEELSKKVSGPEGPPARWVESYSFGVSGYGTDQQWLTLREKVWQFAPDMIVLAFSPNDVGDTYKNRLVSLEGDKIKVANSQDRAGGNFLGRLVRQTYIYHVIIKAASGQSFTKNLVDKIRVKILGFPKDDRFFLSDSQLVQGPFEVVASQKTPPKEVLDTWQVVKALISDMKKQSDEHQAKFLITINIPRAQVSGGDWEFIRNKYKLDPATSSPHQINDVLGQFAKEANINFYDPREDAIIWHSEKGILHWEQDAHFNINGNLFMGTKVADFIIENKIILSEKTPAKN